MESRSAVHQSQVPAPRALRMRRHFDLIASILEVASVKGRQTWIMYQCNLSYRQVKTYFSLMINTGLLRRSEVKSKSGGINFFQTTEKGKAFLKAYKELLSIIGEA